MELTLKDRIILSNQYRILEQLYPNDATYGQHREAIEQGFQLHYDWLAQSIDKDELSARECQEVLDVLDMYRALWSAAKGLGDELPVEQSEVRFLGFDGNNETKQHSYTLYFICRLGRFEELNYESEHPSFNSHRVMLPTYRRMLEKWEESENKYVLSPDDLKRIIEE